MKTLILSILILISSSLAYNCNTTQFKHALGEICDYSTTFSNIDPDVRKNIVKHFFKYIPDKSFNHLYKYALNDNKLRVNVDNDFQRISIYTSNFFEIITLYFNESEKHATIIYKEEKVESITSHNDNTDHIHPFYNTLSKPKTYTREIIKPNQW